MLLGRAGLGQRRDTAMLLTLFPFDWPARPQMTDPSGSAVLLAPRAAHLRVCALPRP